MEMVLRDKHRNTKMSKIDTVLAYFTRITQVPCELSVVGETVPDHEMVRMTLNGMKNPWNTLHQGDCGMRESSQVGVHVG